jgi:hypothetical protein
MPVVDFLNDFPPCENLTGMPSSIGAFGTLPFKPNPEEDLYRPLVSAKYLML